MFFFTQKKKEKYIKKINEIVILLCVVMTVLSPLLQARYYPLPVQSCDTDHAGVTLVGQYRRWLFAVVCRGVPRENLLTSWKLCLPKAFVKRVIISSSPGGGEMFLHMGSDNYPFILSQTICWMLADSMKNPLDDRKWDSKKSMLLL